MDRRQTRIFALLAFGMIIAWPSACRGPSGAEAEVRRLVSRLEGYAEKRDAAGLVALLSEDYADFEGRDRAATGALLADHFRRRFGVVVHLLHADISVGAPEGAAGVEADVSLSSGGMALLRRAVPFAGELYRFRLMVEKRETGWRVSRAEWELTGPEGLFPQSLPVLERLFSGGRGPSSEE